MVHNLRDVRGRQKVEFSFLPFKEGEEATRRLRPFGENP